eukprot:TRINITY_DN26413_c0_g1_i1.p1 TRINITY_DN26413_c0_g1~~TRINITY_DN26413_c0_g1_i1.p1  ORF type:complete len:141 (-),score=41.41 TRINITY_DN26413_c0_g1_i1:100-483(-)
MRERHALLQDIPRVVTYQREWDSKHIILAIEIGYMPLAAFLTYVEWRLMRVYQTKFHPWINILSTNEEIVGENEEDGATGAGQVSEGQDMEVDVSEGTIEPANADSEEERDSEPTEVEALIETDQNV